MEQLEAKWPPALAEQRLVGLEAYVAPSVEIEMCQPVRQRRGLRVERRGGEFSRALDDIVIAKARGARRAGGRGGRTLLSKCARYPACARRGNDGDEQGAATDMRHGFRGGD